MKLKPYPQYKDSGVEWLGPIPAHWDLKQGKMLLSERKVKNTGMKESTVLSLSYGRILVKPPEKLHGLVPTSFETYQIVTPGNIIIRGTDLQNDKTSLRVGRVDNKGIITSAYICLDVNKDEYDRYIYLLLHAYDLMKIFYGMGSGLRQNLEFSDFKYLPISRPPVQEQEKIARFLDWKTGQINRFVRNKRRLIALLKEQKRRIVNQAVTRGLDPNVKLKPSGIDWLGDIPAHWTVVRIKQLYQEIDERSTTGSERHLSMSQKHGGLVDSAMIEERRLMSESYIGGKLCQFEDLVLNRLKAHLGVFSLAPALGVVSPDYTVFRAKAEVDPSFYEKLFRSEIFRPELRIRCKGVVEGFWRLYTNDFLSVSVPFPPIAEQRYISDSIEKKYRSLDQIVNETTHEIGLIQEYRARLVADVVTGRVDVRGIDVPETDPDEFDDTDPDASGDPDDETSPDEENDREDD